MGKLGDWTNTHIKLCTIISACLIVVSLILIIAGAVLVGLSGGEWRVGKETYEEFTERQSRYSGGIAMILLGILLFVCSIIALCCVIHLKFVQRVIESSSQTQPLDSSYDRTSVSSGSTRNKRSSTS
nr:hypothetical protein HmN_000654100 [Hymenolepis microstoma]